MNYIEYLDLHCKGVELAYEKLLKPILIEDNEDDETIGIIERLVRNHDDSKLDSQIEFIPYYEYHEGNISKDDDNYMRAWNHHQKSNPHHWQYWVLLRDSESPHIVALDIPIPYIVEMICDWVSASALHNTTANAWYDIYGENMILSDKSREMIEYYLSKIKDKEGGNLILITNHSSVREKPLNN